jgi:hypothetical protein
MDINNPQEKHVFLVTRSTDGKHLDYVIPFTSFHDAFRYYKTTEPPGGNIRMFNTDSGQIKSVPITFMN